jgi:hypothetical protein
MAVANLATDDLWGDLVVSILSVNRYSLERTYSSFECLREQGLVDPNQLVWLGPAEIVARLKSAGYDRGPFMTNLFALRVCNLGMLIELRGVETCTKILSSADKTAIKELLLAVNEIGPKVIENFVFLRNIGKK